MTLAETVVQKLERLPAGKQLEVLHFIESLQRPEGPGLRRRDPAGLLAGNSGDLKFEDFVAARREAWGSFPRDLAE